MKIIIIGLGIQGNKRIKYLGRNLVATIDPYNKKADYKNIRDVPLNIFDTVFICTPDTEKYDLIKYSLKNKKHVLVEKPLWLGDLNKIKFLERLAINNKVILYVAYNHRFEPHIIKIKNLILSKKLGKIYYCRMFYGNGTSKLVRKSKWKNKGLGVLSDLGSHLLDTCNFIFQDSDIGNFRIISANKFENSSYDHVAICNNNSKIHIELEMTYCFWKNNFTCDIIGEKGSAHIESLCKWGPSIFTHRKRIFPSGIPKEKKDLIKQKDPTWEKEHKYFKKLVNSKKRTNLSKDLWIFFHLSRISNTPNK